MRDCKKGGREVYPCATTRNRFRSRSLIVDELIDALSKPIVGWRCSGNKEGSIEAEGEVLARLLGLCEEVVVEVEAVEGREIGRKRVSAEWCKVSE